MVKIYKKSQVYFNSNAIYRFRFDDDRVTPVSKKEVFEENYGDEPHRDGKDNAVINSSFLNNTPRVNSVRMMKRFTNAYMLVYIRKSKLGDILAPVLETDIPVHLSKSFVSKYLTQLF
jgi:ubiquitin carboxyl-terminal hydrolase 7